MNKPNKSELKSQSDNSKEQLNYRKLKLPVISLIKSLQTGFAEVNILDT